MTNADVIASYPIRVNPLTPELGGGFEALFEPLARNVVGYGETQQEAIDDLMAAVPVFLDVLRATNQTLSPMSPAKDWHAYSGKFNVRVPKALHAKLAGMAEEQGVSLNALIQSLLASGTAALEPGNHAIGHTAR